jgi:phosphohistidine phosphatase SixA
MHGYCGIAFECSAMPRRPPAPGPTVRAMLLPRRTFVRRVAVLLGASPWFPAPAQADEAAVLQALRAGGVAVLLRHAQTTPGVGDPPGWRLEDCASQRNLDEPGRAQARRVGEWFARQRIVPTVVRNSPWCRTRDTAMLAFGRSQDWPALANRFGNRDAQQPALADEVLRYIADLKPGQLALLVSHGSSIQAFVGEYLAQGEAVVVRGRRGADGTVTTTVVGRLAVP